MKKVWLLISCLLLVSSNLSWAEEEGSSEEEDSSEWGVVPGKKSTNCLCGTANKEAERIVGGEETKVNEFPMMAAMFHKPKQVLFCGGTILTSRHVLTAAHCLEPLMNQLENLCVILGEHNHTRFDESVATVFIDVEAAVFHPNWELLGFKNDIGLVVTKRQIHFNRNIRPVCIPRPDLVIEPRLTVLGWGRLSENGPYSDVLMKARLRLQELSYCKPTYEFLDVGADKQICTFHPRRDSCQGDSGGPLLTLDRETNRYTIVGITSHGLGCAAGVPAISTKVVAYVDWILEHIGKTYPEDICRRMDD